MDDLEQRIIAGVNAILGEGGIAQQRDKHFRFNAQQLDYSIRTASGFCRFDAKGGRSSINMLQAATGIGKTLAYLVPAMLYAVYTDKRIAVSTFTRYLQRQILEKDAVSANAWIKEVTGKGVSVARRIGKANYVSPSRCQRLMQNLKDDDKKRYADAIDLLEELVEWCEEGGGALDDFLSDKCIEALPLGIQRTSVCIDRDSAGDDIKLYSDDVKASKSADVIIVNHALMVMHAKSWSQLLDDQDQGRPISVAIFDEADRLPDAAESILSNGMSLHKLMSIVNDASAQLGFSGAKDSVKKLYDSVMAIDIPPSRYCAVTDTAQMAKLIGTASNEKVQVSKILTDEFDLVKKVQEKPTEKQQMVAQFLDASNDMLRLHQSIVDKSLNTLLSWSPVKAYPSITVGKSDAGRIMSRLWSLYDFFGEDEDGNLLPPRAYLEAALLTSATLATPGRGLPEAFDEFAGSVGIVRHGKRVIKDDKNDQATADSSHKAKKATKDSKQNEAPVDSIHNVQVDLLNTYQPTKFGKLHFVLADPSAPLPTLLENGDDGPTAITNPTWLTYCADMIKAAQAKGKRTLVLTLSWRDTNSLAQLLKDAPNLLVHSRGDTLRSLTAKYCADDMENAILLSPGAWEGVDLPGKVNNLVLTRIPFSPPDQPEFERLRVHLAAQGYEIKRINAIVQSINTSRVRRKMEQGLGRALRSPKDEATIWMPDVRFPYPESFSGTLDSVFLNAPTRRSNSSFRSCIPQRFMNTSYAKAQVFLLNGELHSVKL